MLFNYFRVHSLLVYLLIDRLYSETPSIMYVLTTKFTKEKKEENISLKFLVNKPRGYVVN